MTEKKSTTDVATSETPETPAPETAFITHRERYIDEKGVQQFREHGPMPVEEWAAYEQANNL